MQRRLRIALRIAFGALLVTCLPTSVFAEDATLRRGQRVALVVSATPSSGYGMAVNDLDSYLQRSLDVVLRRYPPTTEIAEIAEPVCIVVGTPATNTLFGTLQRAGFEAPVVGLGAEGSRIKAGRVNSKLVIALAGETSQGAAYAIYSFLESEVGVGFFIDGDRIPRPSEVSLAALDRQEQPAVPIRGLFYHFIWKHPHANCWRLWDIDRWKTAIDWMRRKRLNTLPLFHDTGEYFWGDVIFKSFPEIPQNDYTLKNFVVDPGWRTELNHKIIRYVRESGMRVAFNLFYSQVPNFFQDAYPNLKYHELNMDNLGINADQPECRQIMRKYWGDLIRTYGIDDSHLYLVCAYRHERLLREGFKNKNSMTKDALEVLKEIDPEARVFIETWCWKYRSEAVKDWDTLDANPGLEWLEFDREMPREVGVVEWDVRRMHSRNLPLSFNDRPYIQLTHTNMEGWWPPSTLRNHPRWVIDYMSTAIDHGASGVLYFHIQANTHEILADLGAEIGLVGRPDLDRFYQSYARRRFGAESADVLAESLAAFCDAADFGQNRETSPLTMFLAVAPPGFFNSAEDLLAKCTAQGEARKKWIQDRLDLVRSKLPLAGKAALLARSVAPRLKDEKFFQQYLWELDYLAARLDGVESMYLAHLLADSDPTQSTARFERALNSFFAVKELFRDRPGIRMSELRQLEPNVPYTAAFLKDWETRGFWQPLVNSFHVVWERFDHFEAIIRALKPQSLSLPGSN